VVETEPHIVAWPNPYEDPRCQATDSPSKRILPIFSAGVQAERRAPLATCAGCIAVDRCPKAATPHTYGGALARQQARAAGRAVTRCGLATSPSPPTGLFHSRAARRTCAREAQARVRGRHLRERSHAPSGERRRQRPRNRRGLRETGPTGSSAFNDAVSQHASAAGEGSSHRGPVRP
jgi:hypothetical protein